MGIVEAVFEQALMDVVCLVQPATKAMICTVSDLRKNPYCHGVVYVDIIVRFTKKLAQICFGHGAANLDFVPVSGRSIRPRLTSGQSKWSWKGDNMFVVSVGRCMHGVDVLGEYRV